MNCFAEGKEWAELAKYAVTGDYFPPMFSSILKFVVTVFGIMCHGLQLHTLLRSKKLSTRSLYYSQRDLF